VVGTDGKSWSGFGKKGSAFSVSENSWSESGELFGNPDSFF